jgi:hypothetical protein
VWLLLLVLEKVLNNDISFKAPISLIHINLRLLCPSCRHYFVDDQVYFRQDIFLQQIYYNNVIFSPKPTNDSLPNQTASDGTAWKAYTIII